jgi:hypothetical protein
MSGENLAHLKEQILQDEALQSRLAQATSREGFVNLVVELSTQKGYSLTADQLEDALQAETVRQNEAGLTSVEISEERLLATAGLQKSSTQTETCVGCRTHFGEGCHTTNVRTCCRCYGYLEF